MINQLFSKYIFSLLTIGILIFCSACSKNSPITSKKPESLIPKEKLTLVLLDVYLVEASIYIKSQRGVDLGLYTTVYYNSIFKKHDVTKKQFTESLSYYLESDNKSSQIFLDVINQLVAMQNSNGQQNNSKPTEKAVN